MGKALKDIIVIDLGQIYFGSYCTLLMAYQGAKVIKVEPLRGETLRARGDKGEEGKGKDSYEFKMLNSNKESIALNLKTEEGKALFFSLLEKADVLVENFALGVMDKLGLSYEVLSKVNPRLVYASGKGYGLDGPYADLPSMDLTIQAMSGAMATTGFIDSPPVKAGPAFADFSGGTHLYGGIVTALYQRETTNKGQLVEVSMHDTMFPTLTSPIAANFNSGGSIPERTGNRHSGLAIAPYNVYNVKDGYVAIFCLNDKHWELFAKTIGREELLTDTRFKIGTDRARNMQEIDDIVSDWTKNQKKYELVERLLKMGVPCAPVLSIGEVINDPHLIERGMIREVNHPEGTVKVPGSPIRLSNSLLKEIVPAPSLGEHTENILKSMANVDDSDFELLRQKHVIN